MTEDRQITSERKKKERGDKKKVEDRNTRAPLMTR